ncbi:SHOCT domain-containing protein [Pilimelia columellifera]|uniref:SHOCT domain-containing protein n=1 Tax=Pilimelia columellifera subsp. columellifera TaxID=706583 RepID=A0ABN3NQQ5_9ACTN
MPGLLRGVARTAVIAGTATAVSNRVSRRQAGRWAAQDQQAYEADAYQQAQQAAPPQSGADSRLAQIKELGELKAQGLLTEDEFQQQKARVLAS